MGSFCGSLSRAMMTPCYVAGGLSLWKNTRGLSPNSSNPTSTLIPEFFARENLEFLHHTEQPYGFRGLPPHPPRPGKWVSAHRRSPRVILTFLGLRHSVVGQAWRGEEL